MIVTVATYQSTTGDTTTPAFTVSARIEDAVDRLEEALDRPLEAVERTQVLIPGRDGSLSPQATPVIAVATGGWSADGDRIVAQWPYPGAPTSLAWYPALGPTITYTGGWVERTANPTAANRLPMCIADDLCWAAWRSLNPIDPAGFTAYPAGATAVSLGDASVSWSGGAPAVSGRALSAARWSPATLRYRYRGARA